MRKAWARVGDVNSRLGDPFHHNKERTMKVKLTIMNLNNDDAGAIVGMLPTGTEFVMETVDGKKGKRRSPVRQHHGTRHGSQTRDFLSYMVSKKIARMDLSAADQLMKELGASNKRGSVSGLIASGYLTRKDEKVYITSKGINRAKDSRNIARVR